MRRARLPFRVALAIVSPPTARFDLEVEGDDWQPTAPEPFSLAELLELILEDRVGAVVLPSELVHGW